MLLLSNFITECCSCSFYDNLTPLEVPFILLVTVQYKIILKEDNMTCMSVNFYMCMEVIYWKVIYGSVEHIVIKIRKLKYHFYVWRSSKMFYFLPQILNQRVKSAKTTSARSAQARARVAESKEVDKVRNWRTFLPLKLLLLD